MDFEEPRDRGFASATEFRQFVAALQDHLEFEDTQVLSPMNDVGFIERWYRHKRTGQIWRLVEPDGPFRGIWEVVRMREGAGEEKVVMDSGGARWRGIFAGVSVLQIATMICGLVLMPVACVLSFLVFVIFMAMPGANEGSMTARFEAEMRGVTFAIAIGPVLAAAVLPVLVYVRRGRSPVRNWVALVVGSILGVGLAGLVMGVYWIWAAL